MTSLKVFPSSLYTLLPSGILIVEPHEGLLAARAMLLAAADYYVGVSGVRAGVGERGRILGYEVAVAILSESLGPGVLTATAQVVRTQWPHARVLIFGNRQPPIEDNLYDARISVDCRPEDLLAALAILSHDPWRQRTRPSRVLIDGRAWLAGPGNKHIAESDPTKRHANAKETSYPRDLPAGEYQLMQAS